MKLTTSIGVTLLAVTTEFVTGFVVRPTKMRRAPPLPTPSVRMQTLDNPNPFRLFAAASDDSAMSFVGKEQMEEILEDFEQGDSGYCVLDVRNEEEVEATGKLSENIITCPLPKLKELHAFELHPEDFEEEFGFVKPHFDETLVFTCAAGKRAEMAAELAATDGYPNIVIYTGGANEWFGPPSHLEIP